MNYFNKIPTISYNGYNVKNILARAALSAPSRNNKLLYYPYTMKEGERADLISHYYYDDPGYSWLIWLTNNVTDPYYDMPISQDDLYKTIVSKYGSVESAMRKVKCYRNNWYDNNDEVTVEYFNNLTPTYKKYYDPVVDSNYGVMGYKRKRHDDIVTTNRTVSMTLNAPYAFKVGEEFRINSNNYGFVSHSNSKEVTVQQVTGSFSATAFTSQETNLTGSIISVNLVISTIADLEALYWSPVSFFDYENELNEAKKMIKLLDARYRGQAEESLKNAMSEG